MEQKALGTILSMARFDVSIECLTPPSCHYTVDYDFVYFVANVEYKLYLSVDEFNYSGTPFRVSQCVDLGSFESALTVILDFVEGSCRCAIAEN